jgi:hypothetical protein
VGGEAPGERPWGPVRPDSSVKQQEGTAISAVAAAAVQQISQQGASSHCEICQGGVKV